MTPEQREKKMDLIMNQVKILQASFDSVQIFCTKDEPDQDATSHFSGGGGNWFARFGQVVDWLKETRERHGAS